MKVLYVIVFSLVVKICCGLHGLSANIVRVKMFTVCVGGKKSKEDSVFIINDNLL